LSITLPAFHDLDTEMVENWEGWKRVVEGIGATAVAEGELPKRWLT
jgi:hypothetical protein